MDKIIFYAFHRSGPKPGFESAAFPNGLPEALEATVAFQSPAEGTSSDSDHGGAINGHHCKSGDPCKCVLPKARTRPRGPSQTQLNSMLPSGSSSGGQSQSSSAHASSQILARIAVLRPVLPRPAQQDMGFPFPGPVHNPSMSVPHGHTNNRHHDSYAPYTRHGMTPQNLGHPQSYVASSGPSNPTFSYTEQAYHHDPMQLGNPTHPSGGPAWTPQLPQRQQGNGLDSFPSMCSCGDNCACPGCVHHNRSTLPSSSAYASCHNPNQCGTCLDCTIMSLPASAILPPDTALSIYNDSSQNDAIDDWLRQLSASKSNSSDFQHGFPVNSQTAGGGSFQGWNGDPSPNRAFPPFSNNSSINRDPRGMPNYNFGANAMMPPFPAHPQHRSSNDMSSNRSQHQVVDPRLLPTNTGMMGGGGGGSSAFLNLPRSRTPSASSQSSHHGSDTRNSSIGGRNSGGGGGRPSGRMQGMFPNQGVRSVPPLDIHPNMMRGPNSSASISPSPASSSGPTPARSPYASSDPEAEYDPSLAGLQIY
ncbi:hypothetical protein M413DRAFT_29756 [Hebeloma cylindrosporum]|uniref:Copper-fist domain-containing protein n=1 Tax=Hebeloma cylindrosporum TaxID=76867 RepID=A0A0C2XM55_HEBCY|nr:hypothetical protein M413DRAFT_29756 [Hebeloma cylindrosporum h7]